MERRGALATSARTREADACKQTQTREPRWRASSVIADADDLEDVPVDVDAPGDVRLGERQQVQPGEGRPECCVVERDTRTRRAVADPTRDAAGRQQGDLAPAGLELPPGMLR